MSCASSLLTLKSVLQFLQFYSPDATADYTSLSIYLLTRIADLATVCFRDDFSIDHDRCSVACFTGNQF